MTSAAAPAAWRDPAALRRLWGVVVALVVLGPLFQGAGVQPAALLSADNLRVIGGFLGNFLPPETSAEFAGYLWQATLETLAIATIGLLLAFVLIGFFIWLAENISTFAGVWSYPNQLGAWSAVHVGKWSSWSMLVVMTFTIVANLKHIKTKIHVPH